MMVYLRFYIIVCFVFLSVSCTVNKDIVNSNTKRIEISTVVEKSTLSSQGFITINQKSIFLNLFGPLNKNILKLLIEKDSLIIVDLVNVNKIVIKNNEAYSLFFRVFNGTVYDSDKQKLICFLDLIFNKALNEPIENVAVYTCSKISNLEKCNYTYKENKNNYVIKIGIDSPDLNQNILFKIYKKRLNKEDFFKKDKFSNYTVKNIIIND